MTRAFTYLHAWYLCLADDPSRYPGDAADGSERDAGQATTEYALVMLGASAVALLVITWATAGGGAGRA